MRHQISAANSARTATVAPHWIKVRRSRGAYAYAAAIRQVFGGGDGAHKNAILLNASGAIAAGGHAEDLREGLELARSALESGAAAERLEALIAFR